MTKPDEAKKKEKPEKGSDTQTKTASTDSRATIVQVCDFKRTYTPIVKISEYPVVLDDILGVKDRPYPTYSKDKPGAEPAMYDDDPDWIDKPPSDATPSEKTTTPSVRESMRILKTAEAAAAGHRHKKKHSKGKAKKKTKRNKKSKGKKNKK